MGITDVKKKNRKKAIKFLKKNFLHHINESQLESNCILL